MKKLLLALIIATPLAAPFIAQAQTQSAPNTASASAADFGIGIKLGTTGLGIDAIKSINPNFKARFGISALNYNRTVNSNQIQVDGKLKLGGVSLVADYHPYASGLRLTGGLYIPKFEFGGEGSYAKTGSVTINNRTYSSAQVPNVNGMAKWSGAKPYLGIGYDGFNGAKAGEFFYGYDVGVAFIGKPKTSLVAACGTVSAATCTQINADIQAEKASFQTRLNKLKLFPVVQLGAGYRF
jgi:hypothetical protein